MVSIAHPGQHRPCDFGSPVHPRCTSSTIRFNIKKSSTIRFDIKVYAALAMEDSRTFWPSSEYLNIIVLLQVYCLESQFISFMDSYWKGDKDISTRTSSYLRSQQFSNTSQWPQLGRTERSDAKLISEKTRTRRKFVLFNKQNNAHSYGIVIAQ